MSGQIEKGQRVRITFEGEVTGTRSNHNMVRLRVDGLEGGGGWVTWDSNISPASMEVLAPVFKSGDIGVYTRPDGTRTPVVYREQCSAHVEGWYDARYAVPRRLASSLNPKVQLVARADGSLVDQPAPEPEKPFRTPYVPRIGDVALWKYLDGSRMPVVYGTFGGGIADCSWFDIRRCRITCDINDSDRFALVITGGELVELVEGAGI